MDSHYDEFGNYIGPELDDDDSDGDATMKMTMAITIVMI